MEPQKPTVRALKADIDVSRKINQFAIKYPVTIESPTTPNTYITNKIWLVFNLEYTFYSCTRLRQVLGLYPGETATAEDMRITSIKINNVAELAKLGALGEMSCTIRPKDKTKTYGSLGQMHRTSFYFSLENSLQNVALGLKTVEINIAKSGIIYTVVPGTIRLKKRKRTTPHFG